MSELLSALRSAVSVAELAHNAAIKEADARRTILQNARDALAEALCPVKVGDVIINGPKRSMVSGIRGKSWGERYAVFATTIKKDGTPAKVGHEVHSIHGWTRESDGQPVFGKAA